MPTDTRLQVPPRLFRALGLRAAGMMQIISATYHITAATGLSALCMMRHVPFFWESTTTTATANALTVFVKITSFPWGKFFPQAVPSVENSRWTPVLPNASDASWWTYLVLTFLLWGALPRLLMAIFFRSREQRIIAQESFQGEQHKQLWRAIEPERQTPLIQGPQDDALVIDVCGINLNAELLRPILLQRLRLNPTAWASAGNLDEQRRKHCADSIRSASGAIILLAPAELLAPGEMRHLITNIRDNHATSRIILFAYRLSGELTNEESRVWKNFADSINDANLEVTW